MSNDLNLCQFIGRAGKDPEVRYLPNGDAVCNFSIAVGSSWKDKSGEKKEATEWVNVSAFGKLAEIVGEYVKKGKQVYIAGRMSTRKWQDKEGVDRYTTEIRADSMQLLGGRDEQQKPEAPKSNRERAKAYQAGGDDMADDIPF